MIERKRTTNKSTMIDSAWATKAHLEVLSNFVNKSLEREF